MNLLLYGLNHAPELTGIGKYTGELAAWSAEHGHAVRVLTAPPYYPAWKVQAPYRAGIYRSETFHGTQVLRCPLWVPTHPSGLKRLLHLASFALSSLPVLLWQALRHRPTAIWVVAPAMFCAPGAVLAARLCGAKALIHIQDYEVDAAFELGLLKGQTLRRLVLCAERWMLRRFDVVSTISNRMADLARAKGVDPAKVRLLPNWVDISAISPSASGSVYRAELGIRADQVVALYSGNMGAKQGLELLAQAARALQHRPDVVWVFCGNGSGRAELEAQCAGLPNVRLLDLQPMERLGELLCMADIHLLPQRADAADLVMPSKLTGMLASGRSVVATALPHTEVATVVRGRGLVVPPAHPEAFADAVIQLADNSTLRAELGRAGREYAEKYLDKEAVLRRFEADLYALTGQPAPAPEQTQEIK